jgi:phospholipase/carboxylesterase
VYIPANLPEGPRPLVGILHGAGAEAADAIPLLRQQADDEGLVLVAPDSRGLTWDVVLGVLGPDLAFLGRALAAVAIRQPIDPARMALAGFSDGASFALTVGIVNGDLFDGILAFSPGFAASPAVHGEPRIFVSHGVLDEVLPIDACSRVFVPDLRRAGLEVEYREFDGGHAVPRAIAADAVAWLWPRG